MTAPLQRLTGSLLRKLLLGSRMRGKLWAALIADAVAAKNAFDAAWEGCTEAEMMAPARRAELASIADIVAHLALGNRYYADSLWKIRAGEPPNDDPLPDDAYSGAAGRSYSAVLEDYEEAWRVMEPTLRDETLAVSSGVQIHPFFGPLTAREWIALTALHFDYHTRQVRRMRKRLAGR